MTATQTGIMVGAILGIVWIVLGFWSFFFVAIAMGIGAIVGRFGDGKLDVTGVINAFRGKRSSA